jgi:uncharacterized protein
MLETFSPELIDDIVQQLVMSLHPEQIILFGSYAYGEPNPDSDLDLLIMVKESDEASHRRAQKAYRSLRHLHLKVPVDLMVVTQAEVEAKRTVPSSLISYAVHYGKMLYDRTKDRGSSAVAA